MAFAMRHTSLRQPHLGKSLIILTQKKSLKSLSSSRLSEIASHEQTSWGYIGDAHLSVSCMPHGISHPHTEVYLILIEAALWGYIPQLRYTLM